MKFVFIDDNDSTRKTWIGWSKRKQYKAEAVDNVFDASKISADFYVFDISAVAPWNLMHTAYSPICKIIELHPGSIIVIVSGISKGDRESIIEDVKGIMPEAIIIDGGWGVHKDFEEAIKDWI